VNRDAVERIRQEIERARTILLTTHLNPDGDGLGSEIALSAHLRGKGKTVLVRNPDAMPERYRFLDPEGEIRAFDPVASPAEISGCDLLFTLDNGSLHRLGAMEGPVKHSAAIKVCVDHHSVTDPFWTINLIDETACATGEMIYELVTAFGDPPARPAAVALYTAMVTDTGSFRFSKTSPRSHRVAGELLRAGVDPAWVYEQVYERQAEGFLRLMGAAFSQFHLEAGGKLAWVALTRKQIVDWGAEQADTSEILNHLFTVNGVRVCLLFKELPDGRIKVSFRSKGTLDVHQVASRYGGGGHRNAAGAVVDGPLESAIPGLVDGARALLL
jgi:bifunctional oligoribonuclease and PAP phosphatase NrnA